MFDSTKTPSSSSDRYHSEVMGGMGGGGNCMGVETGVKWSLPKKKHSISTV